MRPDIPEKGYIGMRPNVGLNPNTPQSAAGFRIDPPMSVPMFRGLHPHAQAAAAPPLDPPVVRSRFHGLFVCPKRRLSVTGTCPCSEVLVLPRMTAPAILRRCTATSSTSGT